MEPIRPFALAQNHRKQTPKTIFTRQSSQGKGSMYLVPPPFQSLLCILSLQDLLISLTHQPCSCLSLFAVISTTAFKYLFVNPTFMLPSLPSIILFSTPPFSPSQLLSQLDILLLSEYIFSLFFRQFLPHWRQKIIYSSV